MSNETGVTVRLENVELAMQTLVSLSELGAGSERIGLIYGFSGYGKTFAVRHCAVIVDAVLITGNPLYGSATLLLAIATELGIAKPPRQRLPLFEAICAALHQTRRPLIFDEADHLLRLNMIEAIRAICDETMVPVVLVGEETLPQRIKEWDRVDRRVAVRTPMQPVGFEDACKLRDAYCRRVQIANDLVALFVERTHGVASRVVYNLQAAERAALGDGVMMIDRAWWGERRIETGQISTRRRAA